jgi:RimJ/RimL family protein N-acetyltransferase
VSETHDRTPEEVLRLALEDGAELRVRPVRPGDEDGLARLYEGLRPDDRYRRFFSAFRPTEAFLHDLVTVGDRGGYGVLAAVVGPDGDEEVVAEASYVLLPNGDGELAITVADRWRGWLGPYLLDALLRAADERGVPNLEADVLLANRPMLALARARGCLTMGDSDWSTVRVLIGTNGAPTWPPAHERTRVLVEGTGGLWRSDTARPALEVVSCPGPARGAATCPALRGDPCPLAAEADVIVLRRPDGDEPWPELLEAHRRLHPGVPVCVESPRAALDDDVPVLPDDGCLAVALVQRLGRQPA